MKRISVLSLVMLLLPLLSAQAAALQLEAGTGEGFYVRDTANVLSAETQEQIVAYNAILEACCHEAQLVVVTVSYLDEDTEVASLQLMNDWGVGSAEESNGMLLLLAANEYRGWLATGDGIDGVFTDDEAERYLDTYFWDYIDRNEYDEGVSSLASALYNWYLAYYDVQDAGGIGMEDTEAYPMPAGDSAVGARRDELRQKLASVIRFVLLVVILLAVWSMISGWRYRQMRSWGYRGSFWPVFLFGRTRYDPWRYRNRFGNDIRHLSLIHI